MPLRDHFKPPVFPLFQWESFHGQWAGSIVQHLNAKVLPDRYIAAPFVTLHSGIEVDVGTLDTLTPSASSGGGLATLPYAPPQPAWSAPVDITDYPKLEIQIVEDGTARLVAAIELVSPANKDRPANRQALAMKCAGYLHQGASVVVVDLVSERSGNVIRDILALFDRTMDDDELPDPLYAIALRCLKEPDQQIRLEAWPEKLLVGQPLPIMPLWLAADLAAPLDLEVTYQTTCKTLRLPAL